MKIASKQFIAWVLVAFTIAGCSSPNGNVLTFESAVSIETTQSGLVYLQAGGLSIRA
jgi:hypothetical protein